MGSSGAARYGSAPMRPFSAALLFFVAASSAACADLTRPDEILILAEAPPALVKAAPATAAPLASPVAADAESSGPGAKKAGG